MGGWHPYERHAPSFQTFFMSFCAPPVILSAAKNLSSPLVANLLFHSGLLKILGSKRSEDYQHLAENQQLSGQRSSRPCLGPKIRTTLPFCTSRPCLGPILRTRRDALQLWDRLIAPAFPCPGKPLPVWTATSSGSAEIVAWTSNLSALYWTRCLTRFLRPTKRLLRL